MKVLGIFMFILFLTLAFSVAMDLLLGLGLYHALSQLLNPFWVMEAGEIVMLVIYLLLIIGNQIFFILKKKANEQDGSS
ncbi:hypothetical protein [Halalkalibacter flavus]|uniref:hypothetical protein n=1 Tax=Halalkalibacter flavus TaxID=3090668 RepID=UPI002FCC70A3